MAGDLPPPFEGPDGQRGRSRHHQAQSSCAGRARLLERRRGGVVGLEEPRVDRRHGREYGHVAGGQAIPDGLGVELRQDLAAAASRQRAADQIDQAVDVMERQRDQRAVLCCPLPGIDQCPNLRRDLRVGRDDPFRLPGRPTRVEDHRAPVPETGAVPVFGAGQEVGDAHEPDAGGGRDLLERPGVPPAAGHDRRATVGDDVRELGGWMGRRQRNGHAASAPDAAHDHDMGEAGWRQKGDPRLPQIREPGDLQQAGRDPPRGGLEIIVREHAVSGDDGETVGSDTSLSPRWGSR